MHYCLFKFTLLLNAALLFWKLLVFEFLFGRSETFVCSMCAFQVKFVVLSYSHQLLMLFVETFACLEPKRAL
jgi:hypothetical protein